nr:hypothetical protein Iba_chr13eCG4880 [Ipomoea batatas]
MSKLDSAVESISFRHGEQARRPAKPPTAPKLFERGRSFAQRLRRSTHRKVVEEPVILLRLAPLRLFCLSSDNYRENAHGNKRKGNRVIRRPGGGLSLSCLLVYCRSYILDVDAAEKAETNRREGARKFNNDIEDVMTWHMRRSVTGREGCVPAQYFPEGAEDLMQRGGYLTAGKDFAGKKQGFNGFGTARMLL